MRSTQLTKWTRNVCGNKLDLTYDSILTFEDAFKHKQKHKLVPKFDREISIPQLKWTEPANQNCKTKDSLKSFF